MDRTPITKTPLTGSCRRFGLSRSIKKTTPNCEKISTPHSSKLLDIVSTPNPSTKNDSCITEVPLEISKKAILNPTPFKKLEKNLEQEKSEIKSIKKRKKSLCLQIHRKDKLPKKKIDFTRTMDSEECNLLDSQSKLPGSSKELQVSNDHTEHVNNLKDLIEIWRNGLVNGLNILSSKTDPPTEIEEICKELNIPCSLISE